MKRLLLVLMLVLGLAAPGWGEVINGETAVKAYREGDYKRAMAIFLKLAANKSSSESIGAEYNIGYMYDTGKGVPANLLEAVKWYRLAAEAGHPYAQFSLGDMYAAGQGLPQDLVEAYMWFALAAEAGHPTAAQYRDSVAAKLTPDRLAEAKRQVAAFKPGQN